MNAMGMPLLANQVSNVTGKCIMPIFGNWTVFILSCIIIIKSGFNFYKNIHYWDQEKEEGLLRKIDLYSTIGTLLFGVLFAVLSMVFRNRHLGGAVA